MMKKLLSLVLVLVMMLTLVACGGNSNGNVQSNTQNQTGQSDKNSGDSTDNSGNDTVPSQDETNENQAEEPEVGETDSEDTTDNTQKPEESAPVVTASHSDVTLKTAGEVFRLTPNGTDDSYSVTYTSEDEAIAAVDEDGTITAVAPGTTNVAMYVEGNGEQFDFVCIVRCNWDDSSGNSVNLRAYFNDFMGALGADNTPAMMELDAELAEAYYPGLGAIAVKQSVMQMAAMMQVAVEFALVECTNAEDVETVKAIFQARVDSQVNGGAFYPAVVEAWEKAQIVVNGNFVAMIVAGEEQNNAVAAFKALFD